MEYSSYARKGEKSRAEQSKPRCASCPSTRMLPCCRRPQDARSSSSCQCIFSGKLRVGFPGKASTQLLPMVFHLTLHLLCLSGEGSYLQLVSTLSVWHVLSPSALKTARITEEREREGGERDAESDLSSNGLFIARFASQTK